MATEDRKVVKKVNVKGPKGKKGIAVLYDDGTIFIEWVRFSHPHLDKPWKKEGDKGDPKFSVIGMLGKKTHKEALELIRERNEQLLRENKVKKLPSERIYLSDGDEHEDENRAGMWCVSAKETKRPPLRDRQAQRIDDMSEAAELFVGGHWGAILIRPWYQNSADWGKRINCGISAAQFLMKDETFGTGRLSEEALDNTMRAHDDDDDDDGSYDDDDDEPKRKPKKKPRRDYDDDDDDDDI